MAAVPLAGVAELADAHGSGPCTRKGVGVRVPSSAPKFYSLKAMFEHKVGVASPQLQLSDWLYLAGGSAGPIAVFQQRFSHELPSQPYLVIAHTAKTLLCGRCFHL
jgi:hypothetical protein